MLEKYNGNEPFASFQKKYFGADKKYGSNDRKQISHLCYCFFRLGKALRDISVEERILIALFFCSDLSNEILQHLKPELNKYVHLPTEKKLLIINSSLSIQDIFPWKEELSIGIDSEKFCGSFLIQPDFFLRLRPGQEEKVIRKLSAAEINFREINPSCLALQNASKIDAVIELDKEAVVQEFNSQKTGKFLPLNADHLSLTAWDCCAGSGGKSIMLHDLFPDVELTVSDIRESILANLKKRLSKARIKNYNSFVADLTQPDIKLQTSGFKLVLCDIPCTGSGTWSRTPEQLYYFDEKKITAYASLQKKIVSNIIPYLQPGGYLLYITCSVFKKENEEVVDFLKNQFSFEIIKMETLKGYDKKADTMFAALLKKPL